ncbi:MAG: hypothetical protein ACRDNS_14060 [Trebonia sp.]
MPDTTSPDSGAESPRENLLEALRAVREALDIPRPATVGDGEAHDRILEERVMHAVVMLRSILELDRHPDVPWSTAYLRDRLAEHPAEGYKTWQQRTAELEAARKSGGAR